MTYLEGIACIGDDATVPTDNFYEAFKNGDLDIYLEPLAIPFSSTFHFDAWKRYLEKQTSPLSRDVMLAEGLFKHPPPAPRNVRLVSV